jgi:glycosyltransferase involved in cell wall biosynthesis
MSRGPKPSLSIVVPTLNEARNVETVLPELPDVHEVLLVDGGSIDGTVETALRVRPDTKVIHQTRRGKGNALACGFQAASGDAIVMFDADGSADPGEIPAFVSTLVDGADFAKGSRFRTATGERGDSHDLTVLRRLGNNALNLIVNSLFRTRFSDLCYGYNAFWRAILPVLDLPALDLPAAANGTGMHWGDGFEIETMINCRVAAAGLCIVEVPSVERLRLSGQSNLRTFTDGSRVLRTIVSEWRGSAGRSPTPPGQGSHAVSGELAYPVVDLISDSQPPRHVEDEAS